MEKHFTVGVKYGNQLLRGVLESPSLEAFKTQADRSGGVGDSA